MERTVISSMMNIQNASILSSLTYLKIFGELEIVRNKFGNSLDGNPAGSSTFLNPEVTPGSFISNWRELYPTLDQEFKNAIDIKPEGRLPGSIILGKYHQDGSYLEPTAAQTASNLWLGFWPQYETFDEYDQEIRDFMNDKLTPYQDTTFKDQLVAEKMSYTNDEYIALTDNAQLNGNDDIPEQAQTFFKSVTVINQDGNEINVNIEDKYDIEVKLSTIIMLKTETTSSGIFINPGFKSGFTVGFAPVIVLTDINPPNDNPPADGDDPTGGIPGNNALTSTVQQLDANAGDVADGGTDPGTTNVGSGNTGSGNIGTGGFGIGGTGIGLNNKAEYHYTIVAKLKSGYVASNPNVINTNGTHKFNPANISGDETRGVINYVDRLLPILLTNGINVLIEMEKFATEANDSIGNVLNESLNLNFEFIDPTIKDRVEEDPLKLKYYLDGKMVLDGQTRFTNGIMDLNLEIKDGIPIFTTGHDIENDVQMKFANTILTFMSIPVNTYTELITIHKQFLLDLMNPYNSKNVYDNFGDFTWLENIVEKNNLINKLGGDSNGTIIGSNLFEPVSKGWSPALTRPATAFYEELINKYIEQVSAVYNTELNPIIFWFYFLIKK